MFTKRSGSGFVCVCVCVNCSVDSLLVHYFVIVLVSFICGAYRQAQVQVSGDFGPTSKIFFLCIVQRT
jgi:hypothetical protein